MYDAITVLAFGVFAVSAAQMALLPALLLGVIRNPGAKPKLAPRIVVALFLFVSSHAGFGFSYAMLVGSSFNTSLAVIYILTQGGALWIMIARLAWYFLREALRSG